MILFLQVTVNYAFYTRTRIEGIHFFAMFIASSFTTSSCILGSKRNLIYIYTSFRKYFSQEETTSGGITAVCEFLSPFHASFVHDPGHCLPRASLVVFGKKPLSTGAPLGAFLPPARSRPTSAAATAPPRRHLTSSWGAPCSWAGAGALGRRRALRGTSAVPPASAGG